MTLAGIHGRVALVSGAGQGIGRATAVRLAHEGAHVLVNDINPETAQAVAKLVGGTALPFDVSDPLAVNAAVTAAEADHGPVTLLVANHAFMTMAPFLDHSADDFARHLTTNLIGTGLLIQRCLPGMQEAGYGRIVALTSEWGVIGWPNARVASSPSSRASRPPTPAPASPSTQSLPARPTRRSWTWTRSTRA